jgi:hypothetical protein
VVLLETIVGPTIWVHFELIVKTNSNDNLLIVVAARSQLVSIDSRSFPAQILSIVRRKMATICTRDWSIDETLLLFVLVTLFDPKVVVFTTCAALAF